MYAAEKLPCGFLSGDARGPICVRTATWHSRRFRVLACDEHKAQMESENDTHKYLHGCQRDLQWEHVTPGLIHEIVRVSLSVHHGFMIERMISKNAELRMIVTTLDDASVH